MSKKNENDGPITFTLEDDDGNEVEHQLPAKFDVCPNCRGNGKTVDPAIDGNGLTAEDFAEDPDFEEDYMSGVYDVECEECGGLRVVKVVDDERVDLDPELGEVRDLYYEKLEDEAEWKRERRHEREMGY